MRIWVNICVIRAYIYIYINCRTNTPFWHRQNLGSALCTVFLLLPSCYIYLYECIILVIVAMVFNVIILIVLSLFASHSGFLSIVAARCIFLCFSFVACLFLCARAIFSSSRSLTPCLSSISLRASGYKSHPKFFSTPSSSGELCTPYMRGDRTKSITLVMSISLNLRIAQDR